MPYANQPMPEAVIDIGEEEIVAEYNFNPDAFDQAIAAPAPYAVKAVKKSYKKKMPSLKFKAPANRFAYDTLNNAAEILAKDISALKEGVEFVVVSCPLAVHAVVLYSGRSERKPLIIPCEHLKPVSSHTYDVATDSIIIDGIASIYLGRLNFCYKLSLPESYYDKIIPFPESVLRKHLAADAKIDAIKKKYPESDGYSIRFVQLAGA